MTAPVLVPGPAPVPAPSQEARESGATARSSRVVAWTCVLGAVALVAAALVGSVRGVDTASLLTTLAAVSEGTTVDGEPAETGQTVPAGAEVRTAHAGTRLTTGNRTVELAAGTAVTVLDGAHQQLHEGQLLVETVGAPLLVEGDAAEVHVRQDAQVRVEHRGPYLHVTSYDQDAEAESAELRAPGRPTGRVLEGLHEIVLARGVLPGDARPLALRGEDDWEQLLLADVVRADQRLRALAEQLAVGQRGDLVVARASLQGTAPGPRRGEIALARALAQRGDAHDRALEQEVRRLRGEGGSWGVVAWLTETSPDTAQAWLSSLAPVALAAPAGDMAALVAALTGADAATGGPAGTAGTGGAPAPADAPGTSTTPDGSAPEAPAPPAEPPAPAPAPVPVPTPSAGPLDDIVDAVLDLLPDVEGTTAPVPVRTAPGAAAPADEGLVGGPVGGVVGGVTESLTGTTTGNGRGRANGHDRKAAETDEPAARPSADAPVQDAVEDVEGVVDVLLPPGLAKKQSAEAEELADAEAQEPLAGLDAGD